jgi:hypothetical protein
MIQNNKQKEPIQIQEAIKVMKVELYYLDKKERSCSNTMGSWFNGLYNIISNMLSTRFNKSKATSLSK